MSKKLEQEVWALDRCCGCGDCVALCSKGVLFWDADESPHLEKREKALGLSHTPLDTCSFCQKFCEEACPRLVETWSSLEPSRALSVRTIGIVQSGDPNDVIKNLLVAALSAGLVDGAILADMDPWTLKPVTRVATTVGEVVDTLGVPYLWSPPLSSLNEAVFEKGVRNLAVVGAPCVSQAIRKVRSSQNERLTPYQQALRLSISTFCTGVYRPDLFSRFLAEEMGIAPQSVKRLEASPSQDRLTITRWDGSTVRLRLAQVEGYTRRGCARCDDYLGESADLAVGTVGAKEGYSTVLIRSQAGEIGLRNALGLGLMEAVEEVDQNALRRASEEKERRDRARAFDQLTVMMLDALEDPLKRSEVKKAFVRLYEVKKPAESKREEVGCHVTCGEC